MIVSTCTRDFIITHNAYGLKRQITLAKSAHTIIVIIYCYVDLK